MVSLLEDCGVPVIANNPATPTLTVIVALKISL